MLKGAPRSQGRSVRSGAAPPSLELSATRSPVSTFLHSPHSHSHPTCQEPESNKKKDLAPKRSFPKAFQTEPHCTQGWVCRVLLSWGVGHRAPAKDTNQTWGTEVGGGNWEAPCWPGSVWLMTKGNGSWRGWGPTSSRWLVTAKFGVFLCRSVLRAHPWAHLWGLTRGCCCCFCLFPVKNRVK